MYKVNVMFIRLISFLSAIVGLQYIMILINLFQFNYDNLDYRNCSLTINYIVYHKVSCADPENYSGGGGPMELVSYRMRYCVTLEQL